MRVRLVVHERAMTRHVWERLRLIRALRSIGCTIDPLINREASNNRSNYPFYRIGREYGTRGTGGALSDAFSGRIRVPGSIWCTTIPRILPKARILPANPVGRVAAAGD